MPIAKDPAARQMKSEYRSNVLRLDLGKIAL